jgi:hypothetical protein
MKRIKEIFTIRGDPDPNPSSQPSRGRFMYFMGYKADQR